MGKVLYVDFNFNKEKKEKMYGKNYGEVKKLEDITITKKKITKKKITKNKINRDTLKGVLWLVTFFTIYVVSEFVSKDIKKNLTTLNLFILIIGIVYITYRSNYCNGKILGEGKLKKDIENKKSKYCS
ncbi:hypothetical protein [Clostridium sp. KNHs214]|uniref:hypothetical protein n=1 Tax=Clostridium sp. KNHs214 TaxID=1540257 RepID=UPI00054D4571|nr:hypothetical protein [Clostridium sp. KNHs214]